MSVSVGNRREMHDPGGSPSVAPAEDKLRYAAYWLIAFAAFITGFILSRSAERAGPGSRADWPSPAKPHPRAIQP
jgi:hypothetical protein